jgi:hypothetical protein
VTQKCRRKRNEHDHPSQRAARLLDRALYTKSLPPDVAAAAASIIELADNPASARRGRAGGQPGSHAAVAKVEAAPVAAASEEPVDEVDRLDRSGRR